MSRAGYAAPAASRLAQRREDFPLLQRRVHGKPLVYLDNAATTQKPRVVIDAVTAFYREHNSNVHRGVHALSEEATERYESVREVVRRFLNAADAREIVFTRGTTDSINLVASSFGGSRVGPGDEVLITEMEHHSNIVPWQLLCERTGAALKVAPIDDRGDLVLERFEAMLGPRTRIVAAVHVSNALGTVNPVARIVDLAHARSVPVLLDGAQAVAHGVVDVSALGCDFYAFSAHKVYGPTGAGVLYGRRELLADMPPYQGGGDMIRTVRFSGTEYADPPHRFEAGTPNVAGVIGLGAALEYVEELGRGEIAREEAALTAYAVDALRGVPGLRLIGEPAERGPVASFVLKGAHPHDVGTIVDGEGVAIRTGHHCAQPVMDRFAVPATSRASWSFYNTREEIDALVRALDRVRGLFS